MDCCRWQLLRPTESRGEVDCLSEKEGKLGLERFPMLTNYIWRQMFDF